MSDQDFFFEEDEQAPEVSETAAPKAAKPAPKATSQPSSSGAPLAQQSVSVTVAGLIGACALLVGVIVGLVAAPATRGATGVTGTGAGTATGQGTAPQLTPEQLGQGELPQGHPDISGMGGGTQAPSTGATGSTPATK